MYVFSIDIPLPEILFIVVVLVVVALVFIIMQMRHVNRHMKILEDTTSQIRKFEEEELEQVKDFDVDLKKLEADEAELFITKVVPTVAKLENYATVELLNCKDTEAIKDAIVKRGIAESLATRLVNNVAFYLEFFHKTPDRNATQHFKAAEQMKVPPQK